MTIEQNFFALIKTAAGDCLVKRIRVNQSLQVELAQIFEQQRIAFLAKVDTEVPFNGDWKPDDNEVLVIKNIAESALLVEAVNANVSSFSDINIANFTSEPIKALFTGIKVGATTKVLVQKFSSRQALSLSQLPILKMQTGNTFVKATDDIFTIDNKLLAIIENNKTKFKNFHNARMVFDLSDYYKEATDEDLKTISQHASLEIKDFPKFIAQADSQVRKMVHSMSKSAVLDSYTVPQIKVAASGFPHIPIVFNQEKISLPMSKKELKEVLHFLLEDIYKGPLSGGDYLSNSKRSM